jgi:hypothetical protein
MKRLWILLAIVALGAFVLMARPATQIRVEVKNPSGKPVERAAVILDFLGSHHQIFKLGKREAKHWEIRTNLQGVANFPSIPQGTIRLQVIAKDFQTFGKNYDIDESQKTIEIGLKAPQKQYSVYGPSSDSSDKKPNR